MRPATILMLLLLTLTSPSLAEKGLRFEFKDSKHTILPCGYSRSTILGFAPNGEMLEFDPAKIKEPEVIPRFRPYSQGQMRGDLLREFGKQFQVTGTGNYLVVHPKGARDLWANRFEELYRSMMHFLRQRGFRTQRPKFPLVGIVFYSKSQYQQYMSRVVGTNASGSYGIYMGNTNRIYLYDATQGKGKESREWDENLATVMHEAAHQTAFNCGVHTRFGQTPKWGIEGLGCLFEARGIYDAFHYRKIDDRLNLGRLRDFKHMRKTTDLEPLMMDMVASENVFKRRPGQAYAMAWALTFYLSEKQPRDYMRFLKKTSKLGPFDSYSQSQRVRDFQQIFGRDSKMLMTRVGRFIDEIRVDEG